MRLPIVLPLIVARAIGCARGLPGPASMVSSIGRSMPSPAQWARKSATLLSEATRDVEAGGDAPRAHHRFGHAGGFVGAADVLAGGVRFGRSDDAELVEQVGRAVLVGGGATLGVEAEDLVLQRLEGLEELVDARVEAARARGKLLPGGAVLEPQVFRGADLRSRAAGGADEEWQASLDRRGDAVVVAAMRGEIELQVLAHRGPVEEVRLVERAHLAAHELRVEGELMQQPRLIRRRPGDEGRLERVHDAGADEPLGDLVVAVAATFGVQRVEPLRGHDHHLAVLVGLDEVQQSAVALGLERGVILGAPGGDAGDELERGEGQAELPEHLGVQAVVEVEDVAGIGVEHRDKLHAVMLGRGELPADLGHEARPVWLAVLERQ